MAAPGLPRSDVAKLDELRRAEPRQRLAPRFDGERPTPATLAESASPGAPIRAANRRGIVQLRAGEATLETRPSAALMRARATGRSRLRGEFDAQPFPAILLRVLQA
jgi:hypothetical protein